MGISGSQDGAPRPKAAVREVSVEVEFLGFFGGCKGGFLYAGP